MEASQRTKELLQSHETEAITLLTITLDKFGMESLQWDPETTHMEVEQTFGVKIPVNNFNKLMAAFEVVSSDSFYKNLPDFNRLCVALSDGIVNPAVFEPADSHDIAWSITEALLLWPPDPEEQEPFSQEIVHYIGGVLDAEGLMSAPDVLRIGLRQDASMLNRVQTSFSDDPDMFNSIYKKEKEKSDSINAFVKDRLRNLLNQLNELELEHGDAKNAVKGMLAALQKEQHETQELSEGPGA